MILDSISHKTFLAPHLYYSQIMFNLESLRKWLFLSFNSALMEKPTILNTRSYNLMIQPCRPLVVKAIFVKAWEEAMTGPPVLFDFYIMGQHF